jgi:hypothetical protein|tara:strand:+ start:17377 stop:17685 length:309 start_codon:yes stop_codon:yes gene_type:complete
VSKLLPTRLPLAANEVTPEVFNRLVRILEINLGAIDPEAIPQFNETQKSELQFQTGAIIFNTTLGIHQAFDGTQWRDLYSLQVYLTGLGISSGLGTVTVSTP